MSVTTRLLTHADLDQFPDDGKRYEIIGGELYVAAAPVREHMDFMKFLYALLLESVEATGWGVVYFAPVDVRFTEHDVVEPDLIVIRRDRMHLYRGNTFSGAPDIVVEVLSPSNRSYDEVAKAHLYAANGVPEFWIADPITPGFRMMALRAGKFVPVEPDADGLLHSTVVPGLVVDPADLLARLNEQAL
ncbi:MAG: Uma2 family endonuclease [Thermomicrobiales bacterium]